MMRRVGGESPFYDAPRHSERSEEALALNSDGNDPYPSPPWSQHVTLGRIQRRNTLRRTPRIIAHHSNH